MSVVYVVGYFKPDNTVEYTGTIKNTHGVVITKYDIQCLMSNTITLTSISSTINRNQ